jgi:hypothetical protein
MAAGRLKITAIPVAFQSNRSGFAGLSRRIRILTRGARRHMQNRRAVPFGWPEQTR